MREKILTNRYLQPEETEEQMYRRVANHISDGDKELSDEFFTMMNLGLFLPNSPTLVNAGTTQGTLSACFVVPVSDDLKGIYSALESQGMIHKAFGGTGFDFSSIRSSGSRIESTGGEASGPVAFMELFNANAEAVRQGGKRQGANMGVLRIDHPDIEEFIDCKTVEGRLSHFNISVALTKEFMDAVLNDESFSLIEPKDRINWDGEQRIPIVKVVRSRDLMEKICLNIWKNGEPGVVFIDEINEYNPIPSVGTFEATNPCIVGDTLIQTVEGLIPIRELVGKEIDVYCVDDNYKLTISHAKNIRLTRSNASLVKVVTTKGTVICTPDHMFYTRNRGYVIASELKRSDKMVALNKAPKNQKYAKVYLTGTSAERAIAEHRFVAQHYYGDLIFKDVHHIDDNSLNNSFSNLEVLEHGKHSSLSNMNHIDWCDHDPKTGQFIYNKSKSIKEWNNSLNIHPIGVNMRLIEVIPLNYTEDVYDMEVEEHHNFFANHVLIHNCGEQPLLPYESCNLGSINLSKFVVVEDGNCTIDYGGLRQTVHCAVKFLDNVIDVNNYPLDEIERNTLLTRKIGLGVMGWHDMLIKLGIPYDSNDALEYAEAVMSFINTEAISKSVKLAIQKSSFPTYSGSTWQEYRSPIRNSTLTTIAPTGSISLIAECSSGVEPVFAWKHMRKIEAGKFEVKHPTYDEAVAWDNPDMMKTSMDISVDAHIKMQATFQKHVHNAVSKTINLPNDATVDDIDKAIMLAYVLKCKGVTLYRNGSREEQVLSILDEPVTETVSDRPDGVEKFISDYTAPPIPNKEKSDRPNVLEGKTSKHRSGCGSLFITVNELNEEPFELFVHHSSGGCQSNMEAIGRLITLALKSGINVGELIAQLDKIKCVTAAQSSKSEGNSCAQIIGMRLLKFSEELAIKYDQRPYHIEKGSTDDKAKVVFHTDGIEFTAQQNVCPECGEKLEFGEGCMNGSCSNCGWSGCL